MSDAIDDAKVSAAPRVDDGATFLYDYFKHLTSLSVLTLGGVLAISQGEGGAPSQATMYAIVAFVGLAAIFAFSGSSAIVNEKSAGKAPGKWLSLNFYRIAAPAALSLGVGMFLALYLEGLGK